MRTSTFRLVYLFSLVVLILSCSKEQEPIDRAKALLNRGYGINNTTLVVENLDSAQAYFSSKLGFQLGYGGVPKSNRYAGSVGLPISFADMSVLTLLHYPDSIKEGSPRHANGQFLYSLSTSSADSTFAWLSQEGFEADSVEYYQVPSPYPSRNEWSDTINILKRTRLVGQSSTNYDPEFEEQSSFPFDRIHEFYSYYIFQREFMRHPNGVVGISALEFQVNDLSLAAERFAHMGLTEIPDSTLQNAKRFELKPFQEVKLVQNTGKEGVISVLFDVIQLDSTRAFLRKNLAEEAFDSKEGRVTVQAAHAFGIELQFKQEPKEQAEQVAKLQLSFGGKLDSVASANAASMYTQYCALCHGENREGYAADNAPSLKSNSLLAASKNTNFMRYTIQYGRANTAMGGYYEDQGGPMSYIEIELLLKWLYEEAEVEDALNLSREPVTGDKELGAQVYATHCAACHGAEGEGTLAPALGNPMLLATATDEFLRYAIQEGRDGTPMTGFKDSLSAEEIDGVTAFLRSRASGWNVPEGDTISIPKADQYVLNPTRKSPEFNLREGLYVSAEQLDKAMKDSLQLVLLDARSEVAWRQMHIPGAIPVPYYDDPAEVMKDIDKDNTWVIAYCACPHAASGQVVSKLRKMGYKKTAIMDEGILVWAQQGYSVRNGN